MFSTNFYLTNFHYCALPVVIFLNIHRHSVLVLQMTFQVVQRLQFHVAALTWIRVLLSVVPPAMLLHPLNGLEFQVAEAAAVLPKVRMDDHVTGEQILEDKSFVADAASELTLLVFLVHQREVRSPMVFGLERGGTGVAIKRPRFVAFVLLHVNFEFFLAEESGAALWMRRKRF